MCGNLGEPRDYHTKWSQSDGERQISYDITYRWNLEGKSDKNELTCKTEIESQTYQRGKVGKRDKLGIWK